MPRCVDGRWLTHVEMPHFGWIDVEFGSIDLLLTRSRPAAFPQLHAETTGHSNFEESTEKLKARQCTTCGKLCRSVVEEDQHQRFTSHATFVDADVAMTDVIDEKTKLTGGGGAASGARAGDKNATGSTGIECGGDVAAGEDDERVDSLVSMGFSRNKARRALHYTGDGTVEQAIEWISSHEDDPECSDDPFVKPPKLTPEEAKAKAEELLRQAKIKREKEEKAMEKLREAERIRSGKEMAAIARKEEEQRLKRMVELREREKLEEKAAREKIRKKLEQDRMERRARAGLPAEGGGGIEGAGEAQRKGGERETPKPKLPVKPREKGDAMRGLLVALKKASSTGAGGGADNTDQAARTAFETLNKLVGNVARDPSNQKFRTVKLHNKVIQERVGRFGDAVEFLRACGWRDAEADGEGALTLADEDVDDAVLRVALENLDSALNNPFFGSL
jgi:polyhydroxyalkanoate synthesis regulator phasin